MSLKIRFWATTSQIARFRAGVLLARLPFASHRRPTEAFCRRTKRAIWNARDLERLDFSTLRAFSLRARRSSLAWQIRAPGKASDRHRGQCKTTQSVAYWAFRRMLRRGIWRVIQTPQRRKAWHRKRARRKPAKSMIEPRAQSHKSRAKTCKSPSNRMRTAGAFAHFVESSPTLALSSRAMDKRAASCNAPCVAKLGIAPRCEDHSILCAIRKMFWRRFRVLLHNIRQTTRLHWHLV